MSKMAEAHAECIERGIDPESPDAVRRLWNALTPEERRTYFPHARTVESTATLTPDQFVTVVTAELHVFDASAPADIVQSAMTLIAHVRDALSMVEG